MMLYYRYRYWRLWYKHNVLKTAVLNRTSHLDYDTWYIISNQKTVVLETIQTVDTQSSKESEAYKKYDKKTYRS